MTTFIKVMEHDRFYEISNREFPFVMFYVLKRFGPMEITIHLC